MKNYKQPRKLERRILEKLVFMFSEIELVYFRLFGREQFFNYSWLISKFFHVLKFDDYICYVKPLKCKKRVRIYEEKITLIIQELCRPSTNLEWVDDFSNFQSRLWKLLYHRNAHRVQSFDATKPFLLHLREQHGLPPRMNFGE